MALLRIAHPTSRSPAALFEMLEKEVLGHPDFGRYVDRWEISGSRFTFEGSRGFSGWAEVAAGMLVIEVTLTGLAALMKPVVESRLREALARHL